MAMVKYNTAAPNVGMAERWITGVLGAGLAVFGLTRRSSAGAIAAVGGGGLVYRSLSGQCPLYSALGVNTAKKTQNPIVSVPHGEGIQVTKVVTINRSPEELYGFWRNFENLPNFMEHLESVKVLENGTSHWVAKAPAGASVEWDAVIHNEKPNELIAWRSVDGSEVDNAGSVEFSPAAGGRGTEVKVIINYKPPAGKLGAVVATLLGESPRVQLEEDLNRFKQLMEAGEIPTTEGQPSGK